MPLPATSRAQLTVSMRPPQQWDRLWAGETVPQQKELRYVRGASFQQPRGLGGKMLLQRIIAFSLPKRKGSSRREICGAELRPEDASRLTRTRNPVPCQAPLLPSASVGVKSVSALGTCPYLPMQPQFTHRSHLHSSGRYQFLGFQSWVGGDVPENLHT